MRVVVAVTVALLLGACAGGAKRETPPAAPGAGADAPAAGTARPARQGARRSPYAPAQEDPATRGNYTAGGLYAPHIQDRAPDYLPDVDAIPEPDVVDEPRSRYGNRSPYTVLGRHYHVLDDHSGFVEEGIASYYGTKFHGRRTSNMEVYDMYAFTAAHKSLPLPSFARVTNLANGRSVVVRVNDRGPFHEGRVVDLSWAAAVKLDMHQQGTAQVQVQALMPGENARVEYDAVAGQAAPAPATPVASAIDTLVEALPMSAAAAGERPAPVPPTVTPSGQEHRFDMVQDGRVMTADDFDAWLAARQLDLRNPQAAAVPDGVVAAAQPAPAPVAAAPGGDAVTLQVAAFGARDNAERALGALRGAGIAGARLVDSMSGGRPMWRLQIGPVSAASLQDVRSRVAGLGFGQPHVVRE